MNTLKSSWLALMLAIGSLGFAVANDDKVPSTPETVQGTADHDFPPPPETP
jgi:hypothetical protein